MNIGRKFHKYFVSLSIGHIPYPQKTKKGVADNTVTAMCV